MEAIGTEVEVKVVTIGTETEVETTGTEAEVETTGTEAEVETTGTEAMIMANRQNPAEATIPITTLFLSILMVIKVQCQTRSLSLE